MRRYDIVFFDFDGTLVDTIPDITYHVNAVLTDLGFTPRSLEQVRAAVGKGMHQLLRELCPDLRGDADALARAAVHLKHLYATQPVVHSRLYQGVREALLKSGGPAKVVLTNKLEVLADTILRHFGIRDRFERVIGDGGAYPLKPDPTAILSILRDHNVAPTRAMLIRDSQVDLKAAQAAGVAFGWAAYGYEISAPDVPGLVRFDRPGDWEPLMCP